MKIRFDIFAIWSGKRSEMRKHGNFSEKLKLCFKEIKLRP